MKAYTTKTDTEKPRVLFVVECSKFSKQVYDVLENFYGFEVVVSKNLKETERILNMKDHPFICSIVDIGELGSDQDKIVDLTIDKGISTILLTNNLSEPDIKHLWSKGIADYICKSGSYAVDYVAWMANRLNQNRQVKVLIVDDSAIAIETTQFILQLHRYEVLSASSGEEALEILNDNRDIKICLMDCYMDGINGMETASEMRKSHNRDELEIIGLSAGGQKLSAQFIKSGANDFLIKPFQPEELLCRVNHAAERHESFEQLRNLNQLKNQMLGAAAHDIRGPIAAIKNAIELINRGKLSETQQTSLLAMIYNNSVDSLELLESLLDVSAIESGNITLNLKNVNLSEIMKERIDIYSLQANNKNIQITNEIYDAIHATVDTIKVKEVIDNLITNAIKFSPLDSVVDCVLKAKDNDAIIIVSDRGQGVEASEVSDLFTPFAKLSSQSTNGEKQTGLGLAIVKNIVEAHEGKIYYKTNEFGGASFFVELPLSNVQ